MENTGETPDSIGDTGVISETPVGISMTETFVERWLVCITNACNIESRLLSQPMALQRTVIIVSLSYHYFGASSVLIRHFDVY